MFWYKSPCSPICLILIILSVGSYGLQSPVAYPDVFTDPNNINNNNSNGNNKISNVKVWQRRRKELLDFFQNEIYGRVPNVPYKTSFRVVETENCSINNDDDNNNNIINATRYRIEVIVTTRHGKKSFPFLLYIPNKSNNQHNQTNRQQLLVPNDNCKETFPTFLLIVNRDEKILNPTVHLDWNHEYWPVQDIVNAGFATAAFWAGDVDPDDSDDSFQNGFHPLLDQEEEGGGTRRGRGNRNESSWGAIAAWAWGASRILDYFQQRNDVGKVAILGHSRGGKTALLAAAQDERFAMAISNNSGCTGAALSKRKKDGTHGETIEQINTVFPNWFCTNYRKYNCNEDSLPVDQHMLLALIAPRPLCVGSATLDDWADPLGEYLSTQAASSVWSLFGFDSTMPDSQPAPDNPIQCNKIQYHLRSGDHDLTRYDWEQYMNMGRQFLVENDSGGGDSNQNIHDLCRGYSS